MGDILVTAFGTVKDGRPASLYTLSNKNKMVLKVTNFGATAVSILSPEMADGRKDMILGYDDVSGYEAAGYYFGATVGRYAGQIKDGAFTLNNKTYRLFVNDHTNTLHGGKEGFDKRLFDTELDHKANMVKFRYLSCAGEEGFPGNLHVEASYRLTDDNQIAIRFTATSDADTVLNLTNHCYYNLDGHDSNDILTHKLKICADHFLPIGDDCAPNGNILPVANTCMDFRREREIGRGIGTADPQLQICGGYDHNWNINKYGSGARLCAELSNESGTRKMLVHSDLPGLQMYSGNYLDGSEPGKNGIYYGYRAALCLEPQFYPNALSYSSFPSPILKKHAIYDHTITLKFLFQDSCGVY